MSNNKQSSVEWQFEQLSNSFETLKNTRLSFDEYFERNLEIRKQAKAMHKEECINLLNTHNDIFDSSEEHYNKTFNK